MTRQPIMSRRQGAAEEFANSLRVIQCPRALAYIIFHRRVALCFCIRRVYNTAIVNFEEARAKFIHLFIIS